MALRLLVRWWGEREWLRFRSRRTGDDLRRGDGERDLRLRREGHLQLWDIQQLKALCCQGRSALLAAFKAHTALHFLPLTDRQIKMSNKKPNPSKLTKPGTDKPLKTTPQSKLLWFTCNSCSAVGQASLLQQLRGVFPQLN